MERRSFIKGAGALLAAAAGGGLSGCASLHRSERFREPANVAAFLGAVEGKMQSVREVRLPPELRTAQAQLGLPEDHLSEFMASMALVGAYRYSPESVQRESLFQQRMMQEGPRLAAHAFRTANALEQIPRKQLRAMHSHLKRDPGLLDEVAQQLQLTSLETGGDPERARVLSAYVKRLGHRLRKLGPSKVFAEYIEQIDVVAGEQGIARTEWSEERLRTVGLKDKTNAQLVRTGLLFFALGPAVFLGGVFLTWLVTPVGFLLCAVGVALFVMGFVMVLYAGVRLLRSIEAAEPDEPGEEAVNEMEDTP